MSPPETTGVARVFPVGTQVRYKPGTGTYGYEDAVALSADGRIPGVVVGHTPTRVRVRLQLEAGRVKHSTVDEGSLSQEARR